MANSVEQVEAERPGDAHLGSEDDGGAEVHVLQNKTKKVTEKCHRQGAVAEWSKALLVRENKRKPKDPRFTPPPPPRPGQFLLREEVCLRKWWWHKW